MVLNGHMAVTIGRKLNSMQTFLPYPDILESLKVLDNKRLGKQRVESWQILYTLSGKSKAWQHHPAVLMWSDNIDALKIYYNLSLSIWNTRGYQNIKLQPIEKFDLSDISLNSLFLDKKPSWFGNSKLHISHQSNLLRKDPIYYGQYWPSVPMDIPYYWPVQLEQKLYAKGL